MIIIEPTIYSISRGELKDPKNLLLNAGLEIGGYADEFLTTSEFKKDVSNAESVDIQLVKLDKDYLINEILSKIDRIGYRLPEAQDALWFATQYPDVQKEFPIAFLHKPWILPETGGENVIILRSYSGNKYFHMHLFDSRWYAHIRFAVIKK